MSWFVMINQLLWLVVEMLLAYIESFEQFNFIFVCFVITFFQLILANHTPFCNSFIGNQEDFFIKNKKSSQQFRFSKNNQKTHMERISVPVNNHESNSQQRVSSERPAAPKNEDDINDVITCEKCTKIFMNQAAYNTHMKTKHSQTQKPQHSQAPQVQPAIQDSKPQKPTQKKPAIKKVPFKNRMLEIQQNQLQDTIYAFLGQLGEKNAQPVSTRSQFILHNENQRLTGQTNYSLNKVVRTPYEEPIKASDNVPVEEIEKSQYKEFMLGLKAEIEGLEEKVEAEREVWQLFYIIGVCRQLRDPMAPQQQTQDEFSLMDIRKLITNYPKRKLTLKHPHFSIYMLWIARICKPPAFKQFFMIIGTYLAKFMSLPQHAKLKQQTCYDLWRNYFKNNESKLVEKEVVDRLEICDEKNAKKFIEYFVDWTDKFRAMIIL